VSDLLEVTSLHKTFRRGGQRHHALRGVSFAVPEGSSLGIVGQSGSGKTTAVRCVLGLERPDAGSVRYDGFDVSRANAAARRQFQTEVQVVFQDPYTSLDPRMRVGAIVGEPLWIGGMRDRGEIRARIHEVLHMVGLPGDAASRYPRAFSGGQRQRIAIARAIITRPRLLVCDEAVSALDVSVQAEILNLIRAMRQRLSLSVLFVAHDLAVVRYLCAHVVVMADGLVVESGDRDSIYDSPASPYTRRLLEAVPGIDPAAERARRHARRSRQHAFDSKESE
jgi:oligopeptide transport system ATP-binding protein